MTDRLKELLARVEGASGPDGRLDYDIVRALDPPKLLAPGNPPLTTDWEYYGPLTASIDAALALVERVLPGIDFYVEVEQVFGGFCQYVYLSGGGAITPMRTQPGGRLYPTWIEAKNNLPLAILAALLRAKISQEEAKTQSGAG